MLQKLALLFLVTIITSPIAWAEIKRGDRIIVNEGARTTGDVGLRGGIWVIEGADELGRVFLNTSRGPQTLDRSEYTRVLSEEFTALRTGDKIVVKEGATNNEGIPFNPGIWEVESVEIGGTVFVQTSRGPQILDRSQYTPLLGEGFNGIRGGDKIIVSENALTESGHLLSGGIFSVKAIDGHGRVVIQNSKSIEYVLPSTEYIPVLTENETKTKAQYVLPASQYARQCQIAFGKMGYN